LETLLFHADGQTEGTNMKKFALAFRCSFAKAHKNEKLNNVKLLQHNICLTYRIILETLKQ
jgi:hypothetical protein